MRILILLILAGCTGGQNTVDIPPPITVECEANIKWQAPTKRINGDELFLTELSKYTIYISQENSTQDEYIKRIIDIPDVSYTTWKLENLQQDENYFYMTATDLNNVNSVFSNIKSKTC
jgi:hypothetical protein